MKTTREAARAVKITRQTLQSWIASGRIAAPPIEIVDGKATRLWREADIKQLATVKAAIYRRGRGRKSKRAKKGGAR